MRIKNLGGRGSVRSDLKKLDSFTLGTSKNLLIRNFLRNGLERVKFHLFYFWSFLVLAKKIFGPERTDAVQIYVKRVFDEFDDDQSGELSYEGQSICKTKIYLLYLYWYLLFIVNIKIGQSTKVYGKNKIF